MSDTTGVEWTWTFNPDGTITKGASWPVVVGCTKIDPLCKECYAIRDANRLAGNPNPKISQIYSGLTRRLANGHLDFTGVVKCIEERLDWPRRWKRGRKIFVCSQSDLCHEAVPFVFMGRVFDEMIACDWHIYQMLTKRADILLHFVEWYCESRGLTREQFREKTKHIWFGFSAGTQKGFDERWRHMKLLPVKTIWLSAEPLLEQMDIRHALPHDFDCEPYCSWCDVCIPNKTTSESLKDQSWKETTPDHHGPFLAWVVAGGESGQLDRIRATTEQAAHKLRDDCGRSKPATPFFWKQWGNLIPVSQLSRDQKGAGYVEERRAGEVYAYYRIKKQAGRLLDGRTHDDFPQ